MRLIDADALKKKIITTLCDFIACGNCPFYEGTCLVGDWIDDAPTIDAVPQEEVVEIKKNYIDEISGLLNRIDELTISQTDLISRADAIEALREDVMGGLNYERILQSLPSAELTLQTPQTYGKSINPSNAEVVADYISRADVIEAVAQQWLFEASAESPYVNDDDIDDYRELAEELLSDIPSAEAEPKLKTVTEAVDSIDWYHLVDGEMKHGAHNEDEAWYKCRDVQDALKKVGVYDD